MEKIMFLDYETMRVIWWLLLGALLIGFAVMDGFDMGVGALLRWIGRTDTERRIVINTVGPVWEGNQVWLILGAGAIFAAFPPLYAVSFSGFYVAMFLALLALILRPVGFKYRSKLLDPRWRSTWDWTLVIGGVVPPLIFGVALGNVMLGVPFRFDHELRMFYEGTFFGLLTPFPLLCGLVSLSMLIMHGGTFLALKTGGRVQARARQAGSVAAVVMLALFSLAGLWVAFGVDGYVIAAGAGHDAPSNPLAKSVMRETGAWLNNYGAHWWLWLVPLIVYVSAIKTIVFLRWGREMWAWIASAFSVAGVIGTFGVGTFPFLLPSAIDPRSSLTVWDSTSSHMTLFLMFLAVLIFLPIVIAYTSWVYHVMRGKVTEKFVKGDSAY
ncbi:MAG: cytochrome d ubiquinol oxidase subunit II [Acidiferrobacterales bacterium]